MTLPVTSYTMFHDSTLDLFSLILHQEQSAFIITDRTLTVLTHTDAALRWLDAGAGPMQGQPLSAAFPELVGLEPLLAALPPGEKFELAKSARSLPDGTLHYLTVRIECFAFLPERLLVHLIEVTEQAGLEQQLMQQHNELQLMHRRLAQTQQRLDHLLHRMVPHQVATQLMQSPGLPELGGSIHDVTILFADARNYTRFAEQLPPDMVLGRLNGYLAQVAEIVHEYGGTLMQFVGDLVMVVFNAPVAQPNHPDHAACCALKLRQRLQRIADAQEAAGEPLLRFGLSLHTGTVTTGYIGAADRYEFAALGDTTNVAYHLCTLARGGEILVSEDFYDQVRAWAQVEARGSVNLKRRAATMPIFELLGGEQ